MSTSTLISPPIMATSEITITWDGVNAVPGPIPPMHVGETVRYSSPSGEVRILFPVRSPFRTDEAAMTSVPGGVILTLVRGSGQGTLECRCFIKHGNNEEVGWTAAEANSASGGRHKVTPP